MATDDVLRDLLGELQQIFGEFPEINRQLDRCVQVVADFSVRHLFSVGQLIERRIVGAEGRFGGKKRSRFRGFTCRGASWVRREAAIHRCARWRKRRECAAEN